MKRVVFIGFIVAMGSWIVVSASTTIQHVTLNEAQAQSQLLDAVETVALLFHAHPVVDVFQTRKLVINQLLKPENPAKMTQILRSRFPLSMHATLRPPMAWELISVLPNPRLYSLYTAADLGGYGDNNPPYEPTSPVPADGATDVPRQSVTLVWAGGDPDAGDIVSYDLYLGTSSLPPLFASNLTNAFCSLSNLIPGTQYFWKVIARDNWDAETEGPEWSFTTVANNPPYVPIDPLPVDGATEIDREANLSWECTDPDIGDTVLFDVYFGAVEPPPMVVTNLLTASYDPGEMEGGVTYYWQIVAADTWDAEATGPIWSFTTTTGDNQPPYPPSNPFPESGAVGVPLNLTLTWSGGDPDSGDEVTYDLYFGETGNPPLEVRNLAYPTYSIENLEVGRLYQWFVVARDSHVAETTGSLWNFTTYAPPTPTPSSPTPTPEPCVEYSVTLDMGSDYFCPGDICYLDAIICNPELPQNLLVWIVLDIEGSYWFAPSWTQSIDYFLGSATPSGWSRMTILPEFIWPQIDQQYLNAIFWGAMTTPEFILIGSIDSYGFGWGPCNQ